MRKKAFIPIKSILLQLILSLGFIAACQAPPQVLENVETRISEEIPVGMTQAQANILASLVEIDPYPLYSMVYKDNNQDAAESIQDLGSPIRQPSWGCSLFAVFGDGEEILFGRNFDWDFSPALFLYYYPPDGYASVSLVDLHYLGFGGDHAFGIADLPLSEKVRLLDAPFLPFDGMNEAGLVVGMAAVPDGGMEDDPSKETIDSLFAIRKILDGAATVEEAVEIIKSYNIDMGSGPPLHYLIADETGRSALVEFSKGEIMVIPNDTVPWQPATNFLVSEALTDPGIHCWRYGLITKRLEENDGKLSRAEAMKLLEDVAQESTQWSVVYGISDREIDLVMGGDYQEVHTLKFDP